MMWNGNGIGTYERTMDILFFFLFLFCYAIRTIQIPRYRNMNIIYLCNFCPKVGLSRDVLLCWRKLVGQLVLRSRRFGTLQHSGWEVSK